MFPIKEGQTIEIDAIANGGAAVETILNKDGTVASSESFTSTRVSQMQAQLTTQIANFQAQLTRVNNIGAKITA